MHKTLEKFARNSLKEGIEKCTDAQQHMFKRMYAHGNLDMDINDVVDSMEEDKLECAIDQVERTLAKKGNNNGN